MLSCWPNFDSTIVPSIWYNPGGISKKTHNIMHLQIRCLGALMRFIDQQRIGVELEEYDVKTPIRGFKVISMLVAFYTLNHEFHSKLRTDSVEIDSTTLQALEIFHSEYNPHSIQQRRFVYGHKRKEGMSLFRLCNICSSTPGKTMLRHFSTYLHGLFSLSHLSIL